MMRIKFVSYYHQLFPHFAFLLDLTEKNKNNLYGVGSRSKMTGFLDNRVSDEVEDILSFIL